MRGASVRSVDRDLRGSRRDGADPAAGIIHNCTHGNDASKAKQTEEQMILRVFAYLDKLFHIIKPTKVLFMAIDGVAPRKPFRGAAVPCRMARI